MNFESRVVDRVSVIIVSFNSAQVLDDALASLPNGAELIVVDNASQDGSVDKVSNRASRLVRNPRNRGFGPACNQGAGLSTREFLLFLNPDVRLDRGSLDALVAEADTYPDAAAVGPLLRDPSGRINLRVSSPIQSGPLAQGDLPDPPSGPCCVGFLSGAALLCRRQAFERVGGFDERIFLYFEDDDLCLRLHRRGEAIVLCPQATGTHSEAASTPATLRLTFLRAWASTKSILYLSRKHDVRVPKRYRSSTAFRRLLIAISRLDIDRSARHAGRVAAVICDRFTRSSS